MSLRHAAMKRRCTRCVSCLTPGKEVIRMKHQTKAVIAFRKVCKAKGTGLSHYILMAGKEK
jgi:modified peptide precursor CbpA